MAKRLKIKRKVINLGIILIIALVASNIALKYYNEYQYKKTYEYKLIEHGYSLNDAKTLLNFFKNNDAYNHLLEIKKNPLILELIKQKYYINTNLDRYLAYAEKNKTTTTNDIITLVNVNRDYEFYEKDIESDTSKNSLLNVNKYYTLKNDFEPSDLTNISIKYAYSGNKITKEANDAYVTMWNAAMEEGFKLIVNSSYRTFQSQEDVYNNLKASKGTKEADKVAARPGHSEHQSGLAIDLFEIKNQSTATFKDSEGYVWLKENAYKYGFIERYPEGKEHITGYSFEAWHWRFVGIDAATTIHNDNITFDEYYAYYIENQG